MQRAIAARIEIREQTNVNMSLTPQPISIIGGNIAGLSAAYHLARKGCPVTVYERRIWDKPCGGAISIDFAHYLANELGIDIQTVNRPLPDIRFCFTNQKEIKTDGLFVLISRKDLQEQMIVRLEKDANINIVFKHISLKNSALLSEQTVLATGFSGFTRKIIGSQWHNREYALTLKYTGRCRAAAEIPAHLLMFDSRLKGYGWVFSGSNRCYNAGIGGLIEKEIIHARFDEFISQINARFCCGICPDAPPAAWKIPIVLNNWNTPVSFSKNGIEFIGAGDVLGLAHPVIAAGIEPAWQSGWLIGESYDRASHSINIVKYRHLLKKNLQLTSRKPFDILVSNMLRIRLFPFKDQLSYILLKLFHRQIIYQIRKYPWFAMVHDGKKETGFKMNTL